MLTAPPELPLWLSLSLAFLLLAGSLFAFIGALGLAAFRNFYDRLHMPSLGTTLGAAFLLAAAALYSSYRAGAPVLRDALILFFLSLTAPLSLMMISRAAAMRDFTKSWRDTSDNMFWQLARNKKTVQTDEQVEQESERQEAREYQAEEQREAAAKSQAAQEEQEEKAAEQPKRQTQAGKRRSQSTRAAKSGKGKPRRAAKAGITTAKAAKTETAPKTAAKRKAPAAASGKTDSQN